MKNCLLAIIFAVPFVFAWKNSIAQTQWKGTTSVNWATASNWTNGVPTATTDVIIGDANFTGAFQPTISGTSNAKSVTIGGAVPSELTVASTLTVKGNININPNGGIIHGTASLSLTGDWINEGNYSTISNSATVIFAGITQSIGGSVQTIFRKMTINSGSILSLNSNVTCTGTGSVLVVSGTLNPNEPTNYLVTVDSMIVNSGAVLKVTAPVFSANYQVAKPLLLNAGSIVEYSATLIDQIVSSDISYSTLRISGAGRVKALSADLPLLRSTSSTVGYIYVLSGVFDLRNFSANRGTTVTGGSLSVSNGARLKIGGTNSFPAGFTSSSLPISSIVEYSGGDQAISARTYGNLILSSSSGNAVKTMPVTAFTVSGYLTSEAASGATVSFAARSNLTINGSVNIGSSTSFDGGTFTHSVSGNWNNNGTFVPNTSTISMKGANTTIGGNAIQNFNNLSISASNITTPAVNTLDISGNLATISSGSLNQSAGTLKMSGNGKTITGTNITLFNLNVTGVITSTATATISGDFIVSGSLITTGGTLTMNGIGKSISNTGVLTIRTFKITGTVTTVSGFTISSALTNTGTFSSSAGTISFAGTTTLTGTFNLYDLEITGSYLRLAANAVLGISNALSATGTAYLNATSYVPNTVNYNGAQPQLIKNFKYNNLVLSNGNTKTAQGAITVYNTLTIAPSTTLDAGTFIHTMNGNWINNGSFTAGSSTISFGGATNTTISGATTFNILKLTKSSSTASVTLLQNVETYTADMYKGTLKTGNKTLTITNTRLNSGVILGTITRTHPFVAGTAYAFESAYSTIKFGTASGISSVTVNTTLGNVSDFLNGGAIGRVYTITIPSGTYTNATLQLHYEDAELNGNDETKMQLWRYNGTAWTVAGKTTNSATSNYVQKTGLSDITNRWSFTDDGSVLAWNGAVSSDWNNAANWTLVQGVFSGVPGATDIVQIGKTSFTSQPQISSAVKVKGITFGSIQNVSLSLATGASLVVDGTVQGTWSSNAIHVILANNFPITINGDLLLSDGTDSHSIDINMGSGALIVNGSILQSGNANISFSGSGSLKIGQDFNYTNGTFSPGTSTVTYIGSGSQIIASVPYYNLTITKPPGATADITNPISLGGNLSVTSGELDISAAATISGSVNISGTAILGADLSNISVGGHWIKAATATFDAGSGSIILNGIGTQNISASSFNILTINKSTGTANLTGDIIVNEDLSLLSGTFNLSTYNVNQSDAGDVFLMAAATILNVSGANNFPANFTTYDLSNTSTVNYDGTIAQTIAGVTFGNLVFSNGGSIAKEFSGATIVNGDLVINSGATVNGKVSAITLNGNWINNGGIFVPGTSSLLLNGIGKGITGNTSFYDVTVNGSYSVTNSDLTFDGDFLVTNSGSYNAGTGVATVNGNFTNSGYAYSPGTTTFSGTKLQTIRLVNAIVSTSTGVVNFNGSVSPDFNSTTTPTFATLNINNSAGIHPSVDWLILVAFNVGSGGVFNGGEFTHKIKGSFTNDGTVTSTGTLDFEPFSAVNLKLKGTNFSSTGDVIFGGSGQITIIGIPTNLQNLIIANTNAAGITAPSAWIINGDFSVSSNAIFNAGSFSHLVAGDIEIDGRLNGNTSTFTMSAPDGKLTGSPEAWFNNLTITGNVSANSDFYVTGDFANNGTYDGSLGTLIMTGNNNSVIKGTAVPSSIRQLTIDKDPGAVVTANVDINSVSILFVNSGTFFTSTSTISQDGDGGALVVMGGATLKVGGTNTLPAFSGYGLDVESTVDYAGTVQTISQAGAGYGNLTISTPGNKTAQNFLPITIAGDLTISAGNFIAGNNTHKLAGNWLMTGGTFTNTNSVILFNGEEDQQIQTIAPFNSVTINKYSGLVKLSNDITVNSILSFVKGNIQTDNFKVIIPSGGNVTGGAQNKGWVWGSLQKNVAAGSSVSRSFEVGDSLSYMPVNIFFNSVGSAGNLTATLNLPDHPEADFSGIDTTKSVSRYWSFVNAGVGFTTADLTFNWTTNNVDAGAIPANFKVASFDGTDWLLNNISSPLSNSIKAINCTSFGDFEIGEAISQYVWTGGDMTSNWYSRYNWSGGVPSKLFNVIIPSGLTGGRLYPVLNSGTATVNGLTIGSGASLVIDNALMQIAGNVDITGQLNCMNGTLELNGQYPQAIAGHMFKDRTIKNLVVSNTNSGIGISIANTPNDTLKLTGNLTFGNTNSITNTGDNLTLVSNSTGTANVGILGPGNAINGKVTVERYINIGAGAGQHAKSWQLLSTPTIGQSIKENWMENGNNTSTGYGIMLSGPGGAASGFDVNSSVPSIKSFDPTTGMWVGVGNTNEGIYNESGYFVFIRGDRSVTAYNQPANNTTLRTKGNLFTGELQPVEVMANSFRSIGNPYASMIDFSLIQKDYYIDDQFYVWDPYLYGTYGFGGYQTISSASGWEPVPGGTSPYPSGISNPLIQSGQAFIVHSTSTGPPLPYTPELIFTEDCKSTAPVNVNFARTAGRGSKGSNAYFRVNLFAGDAIADGNLVVFNKSYSDSVDGKDAVKMTNSGENFGIKRNGKILAIEARPPVTTSDTIYYNFSNLKMQSYQLRFTPEKMNADGLQAFLSDKFLNTSTPISLYEPSVVNIAITSNPKSYAADRFKVILSPSAVLSVNFISVTSAEKNKQVLVKWAVAVEKNVKEYQVEHSSDGSQFSVIGTSMFDPANGGQYSFVDSRPNQGWNYYRIKSVDMDGHTTYSMVTKTNLGIVAVISAYPNPVVGKKLFVRFDNQAEGNYNISIFNNIGQQIYSSGIFINGISQVVSLDWNEKLPHGTYSVQIANGSKETKTILIRY